MNVDICVIRTDCEERPFPERTKGMDYEELNERTGDIEVFAVIEQDNGETVVVLGTTVLGGEQVYVQLPAFLLHHLDAITVKVEKDFCGQEPPASDVESTIVSERLRDMIIKRWINDDLRDAINNNTAAIDYAKIILNVGVRSGLGLSVSLGAAFAAFLETFMGDGTLEFDGPANPSKESLPEEANHE